MYYQTIIDLSKIMAEVGKPKGVNEPLLNAIFKHVTSVAEEDAEEFIKACIYLRMQSFYEVKQNSEAYNILTRFMASRHTHEQYMKYLMPYGFNRAMPSWMDSSAIDFTKLTLAQAVQIRGVEPINTVPLFSEEETNAIRALKPQTVQTSNVEIAPGITHHQLYQTSRYFNTFTEADAEWFHLFPKHHTVPLSKAGDCWNIEDVYPVEELLQAGKMRFNTNGAATYLCLNHRNRGQMYCVDGIVVTDKTVPYILSLFPQVGKVDLYQDFSRVVMKHKLDKEYKDANIEHLFRVFGSYFLRNNGFTLEQIQELHNKIPLKNDDWRALTSNPKCNTILKTYAKFQTHA